MAWRFKASKYKNSTPKNPKKPDNKIGICCFSAKHAALRRKSKDLYY
jgi:hypothetical protein